MTLTSRLDLGTGVAAHITGRHGGCSTGVYESLNLGDHVGDDPASVAENRRRVCAALGLDRLTIADQRHQATVAYIDATLVGAGHGGHAEAQERLPATDGLVTDLPGVALTILVADCVPVVLYDPVHQALGVAHAGRSGTVAGVLPNVIAEMAARFGTRPQDVSVGFGPHIGPADYEVGPTEVAEFRQVFADEALVRWTNSEEGRASLDLEGALRHQLRCAGVPNAAVTSAGVSTYGSPDYFSDRRARPCGRFALIAWLLK